MRNEGLARLVLAIVAAGTLSACVTLPPNHPRSPQDPWESWNRGVYRVNDTLDRAVAKPVARGYVRYVPSPIRTGVSNFFSNLAMVRTMLNDALQAKFKAAATDLGRLALNTTVGIGGLLDPATSAGLDHNNQDFGLTLGHWGVHPGPFVELPVLGPSDVRDGTGRVADYFTSPLHYVSNNYIGYGLYLPYAIDVRASLLPLDATLERAFDPYAFIRDAYLARRAYLVTGGNVTEEPLVDPEADSMAPDGTAPDGAPPGGAAPNGAGHHGISPGSPAPPPQASPSAAPPSAPPPSAPPAPPADAATPD